MKKNRVLMTMALAGVMTAGMVITSLAGWVQTNGIWYYCGPDGDMWVNRRTPDGYWVDGNGVWIEYR